MNIQILGISSNNPFSQKTFADSLQLPYPLLSDFPKLNTIKSYAGLNKEWASTTAQRAFFLIDKDGIIRGRWHGTVNDVFPTAPILDAARAIAGQ